MPVFGAKSKERLLTCDDAIQVVMHDLIQRFDFTVLEGHRGRDKQEEYYRNGTSRVHYPHSAHNSMPSRAVDIAPWLSWRDSGKQIPWPDPKGPKQQYIEDLSYWYYMAGMVLECAQQHNVELTWGGNWNRNHDLYDQNFYDLPHFELRKYDGSR